MCIQCRSCVEKSAETTLEWWDAAEVVWRMLPCPGGAAARDKGVGVQAACFS